MTGVIVLVIIAAAGIFLAVELAVRVWNRFGEKYYVHYPGLRSNMIIPEIYRPLIRHPIHFQVNSSGERADPVSAGSSSGTVLLAGGSSLLCGFLDQNSTIAACIQRELRKSQSSDVADLRVASIARSYVDSASLLRILSLTLPRYRKLECLVIWCGQSDLLRWLYIGAPSNQFAPAVRDENLFACRPDTHFQTSLKPLAVRRILRRIRYLMYPVFSSYDASKEIEQELRVRSGIRAFVPLESDFSAVVEHCSENYRKILRLAREHSQRVIVMELTGWPKTDFTPEEEALFWQGRIGRPGAEPPRFISTAVLYSLLARLDMAVRKVADEEGVEHISLRPILAGLPGAFYDQFHLTADGANVVGSALACMISGPGGKQ